MHSLTFQVSSSAGRQPSAHCYQPQAPARAVHCNPVWQRDNADGTGSRPAAGPAAIPPDERRRRAAVRDILGDILRCCEIVVIGHGIASRWRMVYRKTQANVNTIYDEVTRLNRTPRIISRVFSLLQIRCLGKILS